MRNPRINITLNPDDLEILLMLCKKKRMSMSSLAKKIIEEWLEEYEDMLLARRAEEAEKRAEGKPTHTFDEVWNKLCT